MKKEKTKTTTSEPIAEADRVPLKEKLAYGIGGLMDGGGVSMMSCVMLAYMTKNGIAMTIASTIMMIAKFWDAITDPFMGFISDNTRGKWGKKKTLYVFRRNILVLVHIPRVFARKRVGRERGRIHGLHYNYVFAVEHLLDGYASSVLLYGKRHYAFVQRA